MRELREFSVSCLYILEMLHDKIRKIATIKINRIAVRKSGRLTSKAAEIARYAILANG